MVGGDVAGGRVVAGAAGTLVDGLADVVVVVLGFFDEVPGQRPSTVVVVAPFEPRLVVEHEPFLSAALAYLTEVARRVGPGSVKSRGWRSLWYASMKLFQIREGKSAPYCALPFSTTLDLPAGDPIHTAVAR